MVKNMNKQMYRDRHKMNMNIYLPREIIITFFLCLKKFGIGKHLHTYVYSSIYCSILYI